MDIVGARQLDLCTLDLTGPNPSAKGPEATAIKGGAPAWDKADKQKRDIVRAVTGMIRM
jgi:hypothetical protein